MKFKISEYFWSDIKAYLDSNGMDYGWQQQPQAQSGILCIENHGSQMINIENIMAGKLLAEYQKQKISKSDITVAEWMKIYADNICSMVPEGQLLYNNSLNNELMTIKYHQLKKKILNKKAILAHQISINLAEKQRYAESSQTEDKKIKSGIDNISFRLKLINQKQEQQNQQLERVQNLIKNGMWGFLPQVQAKLEQISVLRNEVQQLKKKQQLS